MRISWSDTLRIVIVEGNSWVIFKTNYLYLRVREVAMIQTTQLRASSDQMSGDQSAAGLTQTKT